MATLDHGGADVAFELPKAELLIDVARYLFHPNATTALATAFLRGTLTIRARVVDLELVAPDRITFHYSLATSSLQVTEVFRRLRWVAVSPNLPPIPLDGRARGDHAIEVSGTNVRVRFAGNAGSVADAIAVTFVPGAFFSEPLIEGLLWENSLSFPDDSFAVDRLKQDLTREVEGALHDAMVYYLGLFNPPSLANVPAFAGPLTTGAAFALRGQTLHAVFAIGGSTGTPAAIDRSNLRSVSPPDRAALVLSNAALLRDVLRPIMVGILGMPTTGFLASHPSWSSGAVPIAFVPPPRPLVTFTGSFIDSLIGGVAESGSLRVLMQIRVTFDLFTIALAADPPIAMSVTKANNLAAFLLLTPGAPTVTSRIDMPAWVYALSAVLGGSIGAAAMAISDAILDGMTTGVAGLRLVPLARSLTMVVPAPCLPLAASSVARTQTDAPSRSVTIAGATVLDPFRAHDLIVTLA